MGRRATGATTSDVFEIRVAPKKDWFGLVFFPIFLVGFMAGGFEVIGGMFSGSYAQNAAAPLLYVLWPVLWMVGTAFLWYGWAWNAFGEEVITVSDHLLTIRKNVLGYGSTKSFLVSEVMDVRAGGVSSETIEFDIRGETYSLRSKPGRREAQEVVEQIKQRLS